MGKAKNREADRLQVGSLQCDIKLLLNNGLEFNEGTFDQFGFQVFSQWNEDGLIQYLINKIKINEDEKVFLEFGVENYEECNTKFLLLHNNWKGVVIDGSSANINYIKSCSYYWRHTIDAYHYFLDCNNINQCIEDSGLKGTIGLMSVDIDGNDYYIWKTINVISPVIVICEINPLFGNKKAVTVPYDDKFFRTEKHYSNLYFGASINAMLHLAKEKGYELVCINSSGNNLFFVRNDRLSGLNVYSSEIWKKPLFRESRDKNGKLTYLDYDAGRDLIKNMPLLEVDTNRIIQVKDL